MVSLGMHSLVHKFQIQLLGDHAIQFKLNKGLKDGMDQDLLTLAQYLKDKKIQGIKDVILAYETITLIYDILLFDTNPYLLANQLLADFIAEFENLITSKTTARLIEVPVCYDPSLGIDLGNAVQLANCSIDEFIQQHTAQIYTVYCLGFLPGFAYMGDVPEKIQLPRHPQPRAKVSAGSVGIAGTQTGIYPLDSPGGWQIIGRTPIKIFDSKNQSLTLFKAGDQVQFKPISLASFHQLNKQEDVH
jgi:inhibitor of KinA